MHMLQPDMFTQETIDRIEAVLQAQVAELQAKNQTLVNELSECIDDRDNEQKWACDYSAQVETLTHANVALTAERDRSQQELAALRSAMREIFDCVLANASMAFLSATLSAATLRTVVDAARQDE